MNQRYEYIPYNTVRNKDEYRNILEKEETICPYSLLYNNYDGRRYKISQLELIAPPYHDDETDNYFKYEEQQENDDDDEQENDEEQQEDIIYINGNKELVKSFNKKCVICLEIDSIYAFRLCGHWCLCEDCYNNTDSIKITKCVICKS